MPTAVPPPVEVRIEPNSDNNPIPSEVTADHATAAGPDPDCSTAVVELHHNEVTLRLRRAHPRGDHDDTVPIAELMHLHDGSVRLRLGAFDEAPEGWMYFGLFLEDVDETRMERDYDGGLLSFTPPGGDQEHDELHIESMPVTIERFGAVGEVVSGRFGPAVNSPGGTSRRSRAPATLTGTFVACRTVDHIERK